MLFFEISIFASDVFVSKNRPKGHGISLFLVMESHEKSWNLNFQKEYEPCNIKPLLTYTDRDTQANKVNQISRIRQFMRK